MGSAPEETPCTVVVLASFLLILCELVIGCNFRKGLLQSHRKIGEKTYLTQRNKLSAEPGKHADAGRTQCAGYCDPRFCRFTLS